MPETAVDRIDSYPPLVARYGMANPFDLEAQYDNRAMVPDHPAIFAGWAKDAAAYRAASAGRRELHVPYGPSVRQAYDLFLPDQDGGGPVVVFIHGGYWRALNPGEFSHLAAGMNRRGHSVALPGYDLAPEVSIATVLGQMQTFSAALWRRFKRPLVVTGHSAGGHLAACLMASNWPAIGRDLPPDLVRGAYAISGLFDLSPLMRTSMNADFRLTDASARAASPAFWTPPAHGLFDAVVGGLESAEFRRQTALIGPAWADGGVTVRTGEIPGANHFTVLSPLANPASMMCHRLSRIAAGA